MRTLSMRVEKLFGFDPEHIISSRVKTEKNSLALMSDEIAELECLGALAGSVESVNYDKNQLFKIP